METETECVNGTQPKSADFFNPDLYLITTFRRAISNGQDICVAAHGLGSLILLGSRGEYFSDSPDLQELIQLSPKKCRVSVLSQDDSNLYAERAGRSVHELMWQTAYRVSEGRLMEGCHWNDVVQLEYWPNLTRLPLTPNTFRILALFYQHPTSVFLASRLLKIPTAEMYQVYSAARAAGVARAVNRHVEEPRLEPHRNQTLLSSLFRKLARR